MFLQKKLQTKEDTLYPPSLFKCHYHSVSILAVGLLLLNTKYLDFEYSTGSIHI